jgi:hypothetical protein
MWKGVVNGLRTKKGQDKLIELAKARGFDVTSKKL